jgi:hypothetical protein
MPANQAKGAGTPSADVAVGRGVLLMIKGEDWYFPISNASPLTAVNNVGDDVRNL